MKSSAALDRPDTQLYMNPLSYQTFHKGRRKLMKPDNFSGFILVQQLPAEKRRHCLHHLVKCGQGAFDPPELSGS